MKEKIRVSIDIEKDNIKFIEELAKKKHITRKKTLEILINHIISILPKKEKAKKLIEVLEFLI